MKTIPSTIYEILIESFTSINDTFQKNVIFSIIKLENSGRLIIHFHQIPLFEL